MKIITLEIWVQIHLGIKQDACVNKTYIDLVEIIFIEQAKGFNMYNIQFGWTWHVYYNSRPLCMYKSKKLELSTKSKFETTI